MKSLVAVLVAAIFLAGCGSGEAAKPVEASKDYKPETGKLSDLRPGGGAPKKGAGTASLQ